MASILGGIGRAIERLFGKKKPQAPILPKPGEVEGGHRGIAIGLGADPDKLNRRLVLGDEVYDFVYEMQPMLVHSSNVRMVQFFPNEKKMLVEFKKGAAYIYSNVSEQEALSFARAHSKGIWVWDHLRVRGSRTRHKKPYARLR